MAKVGLMFGCSLTIYETFVIQIKCKKFEPGMKVKFSEEKNGICVRRLEMLDSILLIFPEFNLSVKQKDTHTQQETEVQTVQNRFS